MTTEKRSSFGKAEGVDTAPQAEGVGVGGRQGVSAPPLEGGESSDSGNFSELSPGATIEDLQKMGLSPVWIEMARRMGVAAFLDYWEWLDAATPPTRRQRFFYVPYFSMWQRYHRNRLISSLEREGMTPSAIVRYLQEKLSISLNTSTIWRICEKSSDLSKGVDRPAG